MDLKCSECDESFPRNIEFVITHDHCIILYWELADKAAALNIEEINKILPVFKRELIVYTQDEDLDIACVECNKFPAANENFLVMHYTDALKYIEFENALRVLAETNADLKKILDDFDGRRKEKNGS